MKLRIAFLVATMATASGCAQRSYNSNANRVVYGSNENSSRVDSVARDERIRVSIDAQMTSSGFEDVDVISVDGRVTLSGYVDDEMQRQKAESIAKNTLGVSEVDNRIVVCKRPPVNVNKPGGPRKC